MPKPTKGPRIGGGPAHERKILANLAAQLFEHKRIQTTETKAKRVQPLAERFITFAKRGDIHARRRVLQQIGDKSIVHELFTQIAPQMDGREGGYTRVIKTGFRKGDNAPMAVIELVLEPVTPKNRKAAPVADEAPAAEVEETEVVAAADADVESEANDSVEADAAEETEAAEAAAEVTADEDEKPAKA